eukprot:403343619
MLATGDAQYVAFDLDPNENFLLGGSIFYSQTSYMQPYIEYVRQQGAQVYNMIFTSSMYIQVSTIAIQTGGSSSQAAIFIESALAVSPGALVIINYATGIILNSFQVEKENSLVIQRKMLTFQPNGYIVFAHKPSNGWKLSTINYLTGQKTTKGYSTLPTSVAINVVSDYEKELTFVQGLFDTKFFITLLSGNGLVKSVIANYGFELFLFGYYTHIAKSLAVNSKNASEIYISQCFNYFSQIDTRISVFAINTTNYQPITAFSKFATIAAMTCVEISSLTSEESFLFLQDQSTPQKLIVARYYFLQGILEYYEHQSFRQASTLYMGQAILTKYSGNWLNIDGYVVGSTNQYDGNNLSKHRAFVMSISDQYSSCTQKNFKLLMAINISSLPMPVVRDTSMSLADTNSTMTTITQLTDYYNQSSFQPSFKCEINSRDFVFNYNATLNDIYYIGSVEQGYEVDLGTIVQSPNCTDATVQYLYFTTIPFNDVVFTADYAIHYLQTTNNMYLNQNLSVDIQHQLLNGQLFFRSFYLKFSELSTSPCYAAHFIAPAVNNTLSYYIGDPMALISFTIPSYSPNNVCSLGSEFIADSQSIKDTTVFTDIIDANTDTLTGFTISTSDLGKIGIYSLIYQVVIYDSMITQLNYYTIDIRDLCQDAIIDDYVIPTINHDVYSYIRDTVDLSLWSHNMISTCPRLTFSFEPSFSYAFIDNTAKIIIVNETNTTFAGDHFATIRGAIVKSGVVVTYTDIIVEIRLHRKCNTPDLVIDGQLVSNQLYQIGDPVKTIEFKGIVNLTPYCGSITLSVWLGTQQLDTFPFIFQPTNLITKIISVFTDDLNLAQNSVIVIRGTLLNGQQFDYSFDLTLLDPCSGLTFEPPSQPNITYDFFTGPTSYNLLPFIDTTYSGFSVCDLQNLQLLNEALVPLSLPMFQISGLTLTINGGTQYSYCNQNPFIVSSMMYYTDPLQILGNGNIFIFFDCRCDRMQLISPFDSYNFTYYLGDSSQIFPIQALQLNNTICGTFPIDYEYSTINSTHALAFYPLNQFMNVNATSLQITISQSFDESLLGQQYMNVTGKAMIGSTVKKELLIKFNVVRGCNTPLVDQVPGLSGKTYKYKIGDPYLNITFNEWHIPDNGCGLNYTDYQVTPAGAISPVLLTCYLEYFDSYGIIHIGTTDQQIVGPIEFKLFATLNSLTRKQEYFTVLFNNCATKSLTPAQQKTLYFYTIGQNALAIPVLPFIMTEDCGFIVNYTMSLNSDSSSQGQDIIKFDSTYQSIFVQATQYQFIGTYLAVVKGIVQTDTEILQSTQTFKIVIQSPKNSPPYFVSSLIDLQIFYDSAFQFYLPEIKDSESDLVTINLVNNPSFAKLTTNFIEIAPSSEQNIGNYTFQIILRDDNPNPLSTNYNFNLQITQSLSESQLQTSESGQFLEMTETDFKLGGVRINKKQLTGKLIAKVSDIDQFGELTIKFNSNLFEIKNTDPMIYLNALRFYLKQHEGDTQYLNSNQNSTSNKKKRQLDNAPSQLELNTSSNWNITSFNKDQVKVKISFPKPKEVSNSIEYDRMDIKFSERYFFVSEDMKKVVGSNYAINTEVPPQLPDDAATRALQALASGAGSAITGAVTTNIFLSLVMGLSLKKLWMLIQTLQIIVHLPLLQIPLPSNVVLAILTETFMQENDMMDDDDTISMIATVLMSFYVIMMPLFTYMFFKMYFAKLKLQSYIDRFGTIYTNLNDDQFVSVLQNVLYFVRRLSFSFSIVFFGAAPFIQAVIQVLWSVALIMYVTYYKPFKSKSDYIFEIYNEFTLLTISYFLIVYIDIVNDAELRYSIGWYVVIITLLNIFVNWMNLVVTLIIGLVQKAREKCKKRKASTQQAESSMINEGKYKSNIDNDVEIQDVAQRHSNLNSTINNQTTDHILIENNEGALQQKQNFQITNSNFTQDLRTLTEINQSIDNQVNLKRKTRQSKNQKNRSNLQPVFRNSIDESAYDDSLKYTKKHSQKQDHSINQEQNLQGNQYYGSRDKNIDNFLNLNINPINLLKVNQDQWNLPQFNNNKNQLQKQPAFKNEIKPTTLQITNDIQNIIQDNIKLDKLQVKDNLNKNNISNQFNYFRKNNPNTQEIQNSQTGADEFNDIFRKQNFEVLKRRQEMKNYRKEQLFD